MGEGEALPKLLTPNSSLLIKKVCHVSADQEKHAARSYPIDVTFLMIKKSNFVANFVADFVAVYLSDR